MPMKLVQLRSSLSRLGHWVQQQIVTEVPSDIAFCEFDCRQTACSSEEWATCQRRISQAAEESLPCVQQEYIDTARTVETEEILCRTGT